MQSLEVLPVHISIQQRPPGLMEARFKGLSRPGREPEGVCAEQLLCE